MQQHQQNEKNDQILFCRRFEIVRPELILSNYSNTRAVIQGYDDCKMGVEKLFVPKNASILRLARFEIDNLCERECDMISKRNFLSMQY